MVRFRSQLAIWQKIEEQKQIFDYSLIFYLNNYLIYLINVHFQNKEMKNIDLIIIIKRFIVKIIKYLQRKL